MQYMVEMILPNPLTKSFIDQIPDQRNAIDGMLYDGLILNYSLSADWSRVWVIVEAQTENEVYDILSNIPMFELMGVVMTPLMVNLKPEHVLPVFSEN